MSRTREKSSPLRRVRRAAVALLGADLGLRLGSRTRIEVGPVIAEAHIAPARCGGTDIQVPPVGVARLATHKGLLRVAATITGIDERQARALIASPGQLDVDIQRELQRGLVSLGRNSAIGAIAGAAVASALTERGVKATVTGALLGAGALAANGAIAYKTLKNDAWKTPELSGLLSRAPAVIGDVRQIPKQFDRYRSQLAEITASVTGVYRGLTSLPGPPPEDSIAIVWLSDVHNNPLAFTLARGLVEQYDAAMVIDTGDIADWGSSQEARAFAEIKDIQVPYLFIKGNHDGPATLKELAKFDNVVILDDGKATQQSGLTIVGDADPRFTPDKSTGDDKLGKEKLAEIGAELAKTVAPRKADIALVHDPIVAGNLGGVVPLVLCGHTHRRNNRRVGDTLVLTQGSSGGAGLRGVRQDPPDPLTLSVLHIDPKSKRLHTVDEFTFGGLGLAEVSLVRRAAAELGMPRVERQK